VLAAHDPAAATLLADANANANANAEDEGGQLAR
jgi:hypothetical protein